MASFGCDDEGVEKMLRVLYEEVDTARWAETRLRSEVLEFEDGYREKEADIRQWQDKVGSLELRLEDVLNEVHTGQRLLTEKHATFRVAEEMADVQYERA